MRFTRGVLGLVGWSMVLLASTTAMALSGSAAHAARHSPLTCDQIKVRDSDATNVSVASPDGKHVVCVKEGSPTDLEDDHTTVYLWRKDHLRVLKRYYDIGSTGALVWAADSSAFAWNFTYGGAVGDWSTVVFNIKTGHFIQIERIASRDFHHRLLQACHTDETDSNVFFLKWVDNQSLLIAVEAHPGGLDCRRPIPIDYYQVALPAGRIVKRLQGRGTRGHQEGVSVSLAAPGTGFARKIELTLVVQAALGLASSSLSKNPRFPGPRSPENSFFKNALAEARSDLLDVADDLSVSLFLPSHS